MALNNAGLNVMATALANAVTHLSLHTADPGTDGSNESAADREAVSWTAASAGDIEITTAAEFTGGTASGACTHVGLWSASTSGTFYGGYALTGDQTFNAAGEYTVDSLSIDGANA